MDQSQFRTPLPRILTVGGHSFAGLRLWLRESLSLRWSLIYVATTAVTLVLAKLCAGHIRIGGPADPVLLAEYSGTVQNSLLVVTALWAAGLPFVSQLAAKALGGRGRLRDDLINAGRSGTLFMPAWTLVLVLTVRGSLWGPLLGMSLLFPLLAFLGLNFVQHRLSGWRTWAMQGLILAYGMLLAVGYFAVPPLATGYPWAITAAMDRASAVMADSTPMLSRERSAAAAMLEEAWRLHKGGNMPEAGRRYRAVLAFVRHLGEQGNDRVYFQAARIHLIGQLFSPLAAFAADEGLPKEEAALLLESIRAVQLGPEALADALEDGYRLAHIRRKAYLGHVLPRFYSSSLKRSPAQDLERLLQDDIAAAKHASLVNDPGPIIARTAERENLFAPLEGPGRRLSAFQCVWNPDALARCAYDQGPATDYKDMPALFAMATARLRILEATAMLRLDPAYAQRLPEDPFSPGSPLKMRGKFQKTPRVYSIGPDRKDQGGTILVFDPAHWTALPEGDIAADFSATWHYRPP